MSPAIPDLMQIEVLFKQYLIPFLLKVVGAFLLWFLADLLIRAIKGIFIRTLEKKNVDPTLVNYAKHSLGLALKAVALILILGIFGFETTSFSAILAAAGVAIGVAWSVEFCGRGFSDPLQALQVRGYHQCRGSDRRCA